MGYFQKDSIFCVLVVFHRSGGLIIAAEIVVAGVYHC